MYNLQSQHGLVLNPGCAYTHIRSYIVTKTNEYLMQYNSMTVYIWHSSASCTNRYTYHSVGEFVKMLHEDLFQEICVCNVVGRHSANIQPANRRGMYHWMTMVNIYKKQTNISRMRYNVQFNPDKQKWILAKSYCNYTLSSCISIISYGYTPHRSMQV